MVDQQASPTQWEGGSEGIINYLSSYVSGAAISDWRIEEDDGGYVTISYKDYRQDSKPCTERMRGDEFVRRFVMHFLPPHSKRIRYAGFYAPQGRAEKLERARELIAELHGGELPAVNCQAIECTDDDEQAEERGRGLFIGEGKERQDVSGHLLSLPSLHGAAWQHRRRNDAANPAVPGGGDAVARRQAAFATAASSAGSTMSPGAA